MKRDYNKKKKLAGIKKHRAWVTSLCVEAEEAHRCGNAKQLSNITKILARRGKGGRSKILQPEIDAMIYGADGSCTFDKKAKSEIHSAKQRAEYFAKFGAHKFRSIGGTMSGLPCMSGAAL